MHPSLSGLSRVRRKYAIVLSSLRSSSIVGHLTRLQCSPSAPAMSGLVRSAMYSAVPTSVRNCAESASLRSSEPSERWYRYGAEGV